ncbi:exported protein of unknown function [Streptomyces murinus]
MMLSLAAAASAPLRTVSQKVSPGAWCVTRATVIRGVSALPAAAFASACSAFLPPWPLEQPVRASAAAATMATSGTDVREPEREERSIVLCTSLCVRREGRCCVGTRYKSPPEPLSILCPDMAPRSGPGFTCFPPRIIRSQIPLI